MKALFFFSSGNPWAGDMCASDIDANKDSGDERTFDQSRR